MKIFELNSATIPGDGMRELRESMRRTPAEAAENWNVITCPTQRQMSARIGVAGPTWGLWEQRQASGVAAAMVRLHLDEGAVFERHASVTPDEVARLVDFTGQVVGAGKMTHARRACAKELGVHDNTLAIWMRDGHSGMAARLLRYLLDEFGLSQKEAA